MSFNIEVESGKTVKLPTTGKYCDRDILVTATGGGGGYTEEDLQTKYDEGVKAEYDHFWDTYQQNGSRVVYQHAFRVGWTEDTFKPKYDMIPVSASDAQYMFGGCRVNGDLVAICEAQGIVIDLAKPTQFEYVFYDTNFTRIGVVDASNVSRNISTFASSVNLKTIDKLVVSDTTPFSNTFSNCTSLENLTIEGVIGQNGLNLRHSTKFSRASIESVINVLSTTTTGLSITLSKTAVNTAFTDTEWAALANTRSNWTINLV